jgi:hypothetical protein
MGYFSGDNLQERCRVIKTSNTARYKSNLSIVDVPSKDAKEEPVCMTIKVSSVYTSGQ